VAYSSNLSDYTIVSEISQLVIFIVNRGGCDDISYLYLARYMPTKELVGLRYTDLKISTDASFVEELAV